LVKPKGVKETGIEQGLPVLILVFNITRPGYHSWYINLLQTGQSDSNLMEARDFLFSVSVQNSPEPNPPFSIRGTPALQQDY